MSRRTTRTRTTQVITRSSWPLATDKNLPTWQFEYKVGNLLKLPQLEILTGKFVYLIGNVIANLRNLFADWLHQKPFSNAFNSFIKIDILLLKTCVPPSKQVKSNWPILKPDCPELLLAEPGAVQCEQNLIFPDPQSLSKQKPNSLKDRTDLLHKIY